MSIVLIRQLHHMFLALRDSFLCLIVLCFIDVHGKAWTASLFAAVGSVGVYTYWPQRSPCFVELQASFGK